MSSETGSSGAQHEGQTAFSRELLKRVLDEVRAYRTSTGDRFAFKLTDAWVYKLGPDHWEFRFGMFYWHGSADNGYEARAKGWSAWLVAQEGNRHEEDAGRVENDGHLRESDRYPRSPPCGKLAGRR